jgi:hypothetical protein
METRRRPQESSVITRSHLASKIFTASVKRTSGGNAPVDSIVTSGKEQAKLVQIFSKLINFKFKQFYPPTMKVKNKY